jgi:hypothetical protein
MISTSAVPNGRLASTALKVSGLVAVGIGLIRLIAVLLNHRFSEAAWRLDAISAWIDRGTLVLMGIGLYCFGLWVDQSLGVSSGRFQKMRPLVMGLAALLGAIYLAIAPIYFSDATYAKDTSLRQLQGQYQDAENQINLQFSQQQAQAQTQAQEIAKSPATFQKMIQSLKEAGNVDQATQMEQQLTALMSNPKALEQEAIRNRDRQLKLLREQKQTDQRRIEREALQRPVRIVINAVLQAIALLAIANLGLRMQRAQEESQA